MTVSRRKMLGLVGATGIFGKQAVAEAAKAAAGMSTFGSSAAAAQSGVPVSGDIAPRAADWARRRVASVRRLFEGGLPEWKRQKLMRQATARAKVLDPDIASLRSVSLQGKYYMQVRREYDRAVEGEQRWPELSLEEALWSEREGNP